MPLPNPGEKEEKADFVSRCMGNPTMVSEFEDTSQRRAVCESQWDKSKETRKDMSHSSKVAESEPSWGSVDKTDLPRIAHADMGEEDKKSTWKYPHHWVSGGNLYLHKGGLNAAWAAAQGARSGQKASSEVISHLNAHRTALGLNKETYNCECIECGYKVESEEHCVDLKCPKCGGEMRRAERPGAGRDLAKDGIQFFKENVKKQIVYGIVWEPDFVDAHDEWASKDDIMEAAHDYLIYHRGVKLSHGMNITKEANIVESYLAPVDFECNGYTIKEGSWIVGIKVRDKDYWKGIESGLIVGLSAGGTKTFIEGGGA